MTHGISGDETKLNTTPLGEAAETGAEEAANAEAAEPAGAEEMSAAVGAEEAPNAAGAASAPVASEVAGNAEPSAAAAPAAVEAPGTAATPDAPGSEGSEAVGDAEAASVANASEAVPGDVEVSDPGAVVDTGVAQAAPNAANVADTESVPAAGAASAANAETASAAEATPTSGSAAGAEGAAASEAPAGEAVAGTAEPTAASEPAATQPLQPIGAVQPTPEQTRPLQEVTLPSQDAWGAQPAAGVCDDALAPGEPYDAFAPPIGAAAAAATAGPAASVQLNALTEQPRKRRSPVRVALIVLAALVALLAIAYGAGVAAFSQIYYPNTMIMGVDVSLQTASSAAADLSAKASRYSLTLVADDFEWEFTAGEGSIDVDVEAVAADALAGNEPLKWPLRLYQACRNASLGTYAPSDEGYPVTYDADALEESVAEAVGEYNTGRSGTFDAASAYDADAGVFTVQQVRANQRLSVEGVVAAAEDALVSLAASAELDESAYEEIANGATDDELGTVLDAANEMIAAQLTLTMGGTEVATLDGSTLQGWITFKKKSLKPKLDSDALTSWATELADSLCTVGTERTFKGSAGKKVTIGGGTYGWEVDADELASAVQEAVAAGESGELAVPTTSEGSVFTAVGEADWGAYAEVDISEQYAWYYDADGNLLWESGVITGNPNKGNDTPTGVYKVNYKYKNITLRGGYDASTGEYGWETPVTYWMAFVGSSVGFHDATWQSSSNFGNPTAYYSVGSHGCVNLPESAAAELYDIIQVGDCVIVHE